MDFEDERRVNLDPDPTSEVGLPSSAAPMDNDEKWRAILEHQNQSFLALINAMKTPAVNNNIVLPEFDQDKDNVDARAWLNTADLCIADRTLQTPALMMALSKALKGQASSWLSQISFPAMTWHQFKDIFISRYQCRKLMLQVSST